MKHLYSLLPLLFAVTFIGHAMASDLTPAEVRTRLQDAGVEFHTLRSEYDGELYLSLTNTAISDLSILSHLPITGLNVANCRSVTNLAPLAEMQLDFLNITGTPVTDLAALSGLPLVNFFFSPEVATSRVDVIRNLGCNVNLENSGPFWAEYDSAAASRLRRAGIGYDRLEVLSNGLWAVSLAQTRITDLSGLRGMPISHLGLSETAVSDLSPLRGMPLLDLDLTFTQVKDLTPLRGMNIQVLWLAQIPARDFAPLRGLPLTSLALDETSISDLSVLAGMPLEWLSIRATPVVDLSPLRDLPLKDLFLPDTPVCDLSPLRTLPLARLQISNTRVSDLTPLSDVPLQSLLFSPHSIDEGLDMIRRKATLKEMGMDWGLLWPPNVFWKKFDSGELQKNRRADPSGEGSPTQAVELPIP